MKTTDKILQAIQQDENYLDTIKYCKSSGTSIELGDIKNCFYRTEEKRVTITVSIECTFSLNNKVKVQNQDFNIRVGLVTPKGYFSTKKIPVEVVDNDNLTELELTSLMEYYNASTKDNDFDPRFYENNQQRKNAAGWSFVASRLQPDCR